MNVFVSASSIKQKSDDYNKVLIKISELINKYDDTLCVGGNTGSMSLLLENTNNKRIIINESYKDQTDDLVDTILVKDSYDRTSMIIKENDMFIIMPGSIGSVSELLALLESKRSDGNKKTIVLFNLNNYYDTLLKFLDETYEKKFIKERIDKYLFVINDIGSLEEIRRNIK